VKKDKASFIGWMKVAATKPSKSFGDLPGKDTALEKRKMSVLPTQMLMRLKRLLLASRAVDLLSRTWR
jgi:hypothetical protein